MNNIQLCEHDICTGCMACYNTCEKQAIEIIEDEEGFSYPKIDQIKCIQCKRCQKVCPVLNPKQKNDFSQYGYVCWNKNEDLVKHSSSGALFTSLAEEIINMGGYVVGAAFDNKFKVKHIIINNLNDLNRLRYSKYVQSDIALVYKDIKTYLTNNKHVLFTGTPCQVAGLRNFLVKDYDNLITCDFVCHGVPSPIIFANYKQWLEKQYKSSLVDFVFRDKKWSWMSFNIKATFQNGKIYYGTWFKDKYLRLFLGELISRKSCYSCKYCNMNRPSDITIADFWGVRFKRNEISNYKDTGLSLALINSKKGEILFEKSKKTLIYYKRSAKDIQLSQKSFNSPWQEPKNRNKFWKDYRALKFDELLQKYALAKHTPTTFKIRQIFGRGIISNILCKIFKYIA